MGESLKRDRIFVKSQSFLQKYLLIAPVILTYIYVTYVYIPICIYVYIYVYIPPKRWKEVKLNFSFLEGGLDIGVTHSTVYGKDKK